jgi:hypothetical protein
MSHHAAGPTHAHPVGIGCAARRPFRDRHADLGLDVARDHVSARRRRGRDFRRLSLRARRLLLAIWCRATGRSLAFSRRNHRFLCAQGVLMFGANYVAIYEAERYLTSGLVAVLFSTIVFTNPIGCGSCMAAPIAKRTLFAAALGVAVSCLLFLPNC